MGDAAQGKGAQEPRQSTHPDEVLIFVNFARAERDKPPLTAKELPYDSPTSSEADSDSGDDRYPTGRPVGPSPRPDRDDGSSRLVCRFGFFARLGRTAGFPSEELGGHGP